MRFKLIVGNRRFQVDEISEAKLVFYKCETSGLSHKGLFIPQQVSGEISATLKLENLTKNMPEVDPLIGATFHMEGSVLRGIIFQVPAEYFHSFKKISTHGPWKKVDYTDDFFICSCRNMLVLRNALMIEAGRVDNGAVELTFKFEHFETFSIELLDKVIESTYKKRET